MEAAPILGVLYFSEFPAQGDGAGKSSTFVTSRFDERNDPLKMKLKEVLNEARCDGGMQVGSGVGTPFPGKTPDLRWLIINALPHLDDDLPTRVLPTLRGRMSRQYSFCAFYSFLHCRLR